MNRDIALIYPETSVMTTIKAYIHILKLRIDILIAFSAIAGYIITASRDEFSFIKLLLIIFFDPIFLINLNYNE